ncbi:MAG: ThuA domain-containing protein [Bacteroidales bacterium]|nr:ThuA domain-containing protein [Bacteroidales bacterium]
MRQILVIMIAMITSLGMAQDGGLNGKSVLIYTRNGEGYVHDNIAASVEALEEICSSIGIKTMHTDDPVIFEKKGLQKYDAIIFSNSNNEAFLTEEQRAAFKEYILSGKGFMAIHSANASERDWPWYAEMVGGKFIRHPKLQKFDIHVIDPTHVSTSHLPKVWQWEDECYYSNYLNPAIHVLLAADLGTIKDDEKDEYPGDVFGNLFPLAWYHVVEGTRVFYTALGHKIEYYDDTFFRQHLQGGIVWILE